jgi:hypothetical protein
LGCCAPQSAPRQRSGESRLLGLWKSRREAPDGIVNVLAGNGQLQRVVTEYLAPKFVVVGKGVLAGFTFCYVIVLKCGEFAMRHVLEEFGPRVSSVGTASRGRMEDGQMMRTMPRIWLCDGWMVCRG